MLLHVAAENKRVGSLEQALVAAESLAWSMLQFLVQVEIVFAFAAVAALVTVKRALTSVDTHVFYQLVGGLGQVATLVTLVMVAKAVFSDVHLQLQLICFHCLADPTFVLHLVVSLQVALHCCRAVSGVDAEWAPLWGRFCKAGQVVQWVTDSQVLLVTTFLVFAQSHFCHFLHSEVV